MDGMNKDATYALCTETFKKVHDQHEQDIKNHLARISNDNGKASVQDLLVMAMVQSEKFAYDYAMKLISCFFPD